MCERVRRVGGGSIGDRGSRTARNKRVQPLQESVDEYKKAEGNAGKDIKVVSFSNAIWKDLERISMPRHKVVVINFESLLTSIRLHMPESLLKATEAEVPRLDDVLQDLNGFVGTQTESGARVFINQWLIAVKRILRNEFAAFVWTELCLSSASAQPVHIEEDNQTTFLTGVIDYGLASMRITMVEEEETVMQQRISIMNELQTKRIVGVFGQHRVTFVIIEAKNDRERLETHIPQVALQCVALEEEWTEGGSKIVAFCLANSKRWMFGVVDRVSGRIFHTKEQNVTQDLLQILLGLVFWASNSSQDILITILLAIKACVQ
ncbi:hypothetical protein PTI98_000284 [Pleurotus ostreatus]|nr:hypothetical protein PTI98_000284 [Pleurotus ostreatus]